ncbi:MAG TPA: NAD-dependent epimerase/dehydratase family protein [Bryobacteraceae bacterium]|nr:oxidoreductase [Bryobacterales bacterium]HRJ18590.1 NAD-dependent epimerase/dehydratase family protein [Bryobacteraceae bacterium]
MPRNVAVVAGATGLVGRYLLEVLLEDSFYDQIVVLVRRPLERFERKLEQRMVDFENLRSTDLAGGTHLFSCLGTTMKKAGSQAAFRRVDYDYPLMLARLGQEAGALRFMLVSSVGADPDAGSFYLRVKGELERDLEAIHFEATHVFRPAVLLGRREEARGGEEWAARLSRALEWMMAGGLSKYRPMPAGVLAASMAAAGERGEPGRHVHHYNQIVRLAGF